MADYEFDRTTNLPAAPETIWQRITDIPLLVGWISVLHDAREVDRLKRYAAVIEDKVGMFRLRADLDIRVTDVEEQRRITLQAEGRDRQVGSRISIAATVQLDPALDGTRLRVSGRYGITGNAATLGASAVKRKGTKVLDEFFGSLTAELST